MINRRSLNGNQGKCWIKVRRLANIARKRQRTPTCPHLAHCNGAKRPRTGQWLIDGIYRRSVKTLGPRLHLEGDVLPFGQGAETVTLYGAEKHEDIFPTIFRRNEPIAFSIIEPLHSTSTHRTTSYPFVIIPV